MSEVNVTIFDRNYRLAVTTGEEKMLEDCARQVNEQMLAVRATGRVIAIDQIAVLTALVNLATTVGLVWFFADQLF